MCGRERRCPRRFVWSELTSTPLPGGNCSGGAPLPLSACFLGREASFSQAKEPLISLLHGGCPEGSDLDSWAAAQPGGGGLLLSGEGSEKSRFQPVQNKAACSPLLSPAPVALLDKCGPCSLPADTVLSLCLTWRSLQGSAYLCSTSVSSTQH